MNQRGFPYWSAGNKVKVGRGGVIWGASYDPVWGIANKSLAQRGQFILWTLPGHWCAGHYWPWHQCLLSRCLSETQGGCDMTLSFSRRPKHLRWRVTSLWCLSKDIVIRHTWHVGGVHFIPPVLSFLLVHTPTSQPALHRLTGWRQDTWSEYHRAIAYGSSKKLRVAVDLCGQVKAAVQWSPPAQDDRRPTPQASEAGLELWQFWHLWRKR